jgi:hypothetical protein
MRWLILICLWCSVFGLHAQEKNYSFKVISDQGERLTSAYIIADCYDGLIETDEFGVVTFTCSKSLEQVFVSCFGFQSLSVSVDTLSNPIIRLKPNSLPEIQVSAPSVIKDYASTGYHGITANLVNRMPALFGETDVIKTLAFLPGISQVNELSGRINVRGGNGDHNLVLLNDIPIINPVHAFGLISPFNSKCIRSVKLFKNRLPGEIGNALSSAIVLDTKKGSVDEFQLDLGVGLLTSDLTVQGPISRKRGISYMASVRGIYSTAIFLPVRALTAGNDNADYPYFGMYDVMGLLDWEMSGSSSLRMSYYQSRDFIGEVFKTGRVEDIIELGWGNRAFGLTYKYRWSNWAFRSALYHTSNFTEDFSKYANKEDDLLIQANTKSSVFHTGWKNTLLYTVSRFSLQVGLEARQTELIPNELEVTTEEGRDFSEVRQSSITGGLFMDMQYELTQAMDLKFTGRGDQQWGDGFGYGFLSSSLEINYKGNKNWNAYLGVNRNGQFQHLMSISNSGLVGDVWVGTNSAIRPTSMNQVYMGWYYGGPAQNYAIEVSAFYRRYNDLLRLRSSNFTGFSPPKLSENWDEDVFLKGNRDCYGIELSGHWNISKKHTLNSSFTYARCKESFPDLENGRVFNADMDIPIMLDLELNTQLNKKWSMSARFNIRSGAPATLPEAIFLDPFGYERIIYEDLNSSRFPIYHRADLSFIKRYYSSKSGRPREWVFSLYNAYSRLNPTTFSFQRYVEERINGTPQLVYSPRFEYGWVLPIIPGIKFNMTW